MSRIIIFGDSNSYGMGLSDPMTQNYGYHLSKLYNREYINTAAPGSSNTKIMYEILNFDFKDNDLVIIGWSYFCRELIVKGKDKIENLGSWINQKAPRNRAWIEHVYDSYDLTVKSYMNMHHANTYLKTKNIKVLQFCFEEDKQLIDIKNDYVWAKDIVMDIDIYTEIVGVDLTECNHPGPLTHKLSAEYLYNKFKDIV